MSIKEVDNQSLMTNNEQDAAMLQDATSLSVYTVL